MGNKLMKKLFLTILLILSIPALCNAGGVMMMGGGASAVACSTIAQEDVAEYEAENLAATKYVGTKFVASGNHVVCSLSIYAKRHASSTLNTILEIWSHDAGGNEPDSLLASSASIPYATIPTSLGWISAAISYTLSSGTTYWIVRNNGDAGYNFSWGVGDSATEQIDTSADGATWTNTVTNKAGMVRIYK